jgi:uncharacterized protein YggU (UPF0235/DUF167 family)
MIMIDPLPACRRLSDGLAILVRLTPKGGRDALDGLTELSDGRTALKARVRTAPENGEANAALEALLAKACGCGKSQSSVTTGATSRLKTVTVSGQPDQLLAALHHTLNSQGSPA